MELGKLRKGRKGRPLDPIAKRRAKIEPAAWYPDDLHPMDGYLLVARRYGESVDHLRTWIPRRGEIVYALRQRGVGMARIAVLMRVSKRTIYRWLDAYLTQAAEFNEELEHPKPVVPL